MYSNTFTKINEYLLNNTDVMYMHKLIKFNCFNLQTILAETEIHKTYLKTILRSLTEKPSQSSILLKNPPCENIKLTDEFYINEAFTSESNK